MRPRIILWPLFLLYNKIFLDVNKSLLYHLYMKDKRKIIYGLIDPRDSQLKYIGKSVSGINRPRQHTKPSNLNRDTPKINWIKELLSLNIKPEIIIIEECCSNEELNEYEDFWIEYFKYIGADLTNSCWGGKGTPGYKHKKETLIILSEKAKQRDKTKRLEIAIKTRKPHIFINGIESKKCAKCKQIKELTFFVKNKKEPRGYSPYCKLCFKLINKEFREKNPYVKLTSEELKKVYKLRGKRISESLNRPEIKQKFINSCKKSLSVENLNTREIKQYQSLTDFTKEIGGSNSGASLAIKQNRPYKIYKLKYTGQMT